MEHQPPGTYILRELNDVALPEHVSWFPQTLGWQVLACAIAIYAIYRMVKWFQSWWGNRYRREALSLLLEIKQTHFFDDISIEERVQIGQDYFQIMKAVLVYLKPELANKHGKAFLAALDCFILKPTFEEELGYKWTVSLLQKSKALTSEELLALTALCESWIREHSLQNASISSEVKQNG
ncbi:DUF4381 domain-containing protein [Vibrio sp. 99-70-13A1]|uniref:DUF4381 domain-containing protein n=1 Tax=Vibrio sp. 99-70-13A1 TaxID=2607601 RepID=UPI0014932DD3|nr:DUF4381 domain-containing protein [Vibrio sp. 99-70-13A1]NOH95655.1 DUF4381 domain-containing protein [Vibrio sp. 99-70-13A1]